ncbi:MAG: hypothetical protein WAM60_08820 [Candidatus Promineifilaceae bacterium]
MDGEPFYERQAKQHFQQARRQATREQLSAWLTGNEDSLLPFEAIRAQLKSEDPLYEGLQSVSLTQIVGSVGRYKDFTRRFLPRSNSMQDRWVNVEALTVQRGWPPIELYRIGDVYFVKDGNHRVAIANQMGNDTIEAHVWGFPKALPISPKDSLGEILIRLGEREFIEKTGLDVSCPNHHIQCTIPGQYTEFLAQIQELHEKLALIDGEKMPYKEAVVAWYEMIYLPTVQIIRESTLLEQFPGRTEADLFVWLSNHRQELSELYGDGSLADWVEILCEQYKESGLKRILRKVRGMLGGDERPPLEKV